MARGLAVAHELGGPHQRGVLLAAHPAGRVLVHADDLGAGHQLEALRVADLLGRADQHDADAVLGRRHAGRPRRSSPGALSPPMASTATGSVASVSGEGRSPRRLKSVDLDRLASLVPAAARADDVRRLGRLAVRAHAARPAGRAATPRPGGCGPWPWTSSSSGQPWRVSNDRFGALGRSRTAPARRNRLPEHVEVSPPGVAWGNAAALALVAVGPAPGAQAGAVGPAQGRHRQLEHDRVAHQGAEVELVVDDRVELLVGARRPAGRRRSARARGSAAPPPPARRSAGRSRPTAPSRCRRRRSRPRRARG